MVAAETTLDDELAKADQGAKLRNGKPDRARSKCLSTYVSEDVYWKLKMVSAEQRTEMQDLVTTALTDLFAKLGKRQPRPGI